MKRPLLTSGILGTLILITCYATSASGGQAVSTPTFWKRTGPDIHNTNTGSVGIGMPAQPGAILTIANDMQIKGGSALLFQAGNPARTQIASSAPLRITTDALGIGMDAQGGALVSVANDLQVIGGSGLLFQAGNSSRCQIASSSDLILTAVGRIGVNTPSPATTLDVNGALTIRGGADIVEGFDSCERLEPGTVVVIDPQNPGCLRASREGYDPKVAGVVSGAGGVAPGINLGQDGLLDGPTKVAMAGRVYVKASAENGPIRPGDRLTTASLAGHAMRATDAQRCDGSVIGKAMSSLDEGTGLVLVLVNLQ